MPFFFSHRELRLRIHLSTPKLGENNRGQIHPKYTLQNIPIDWIQDNQLLLITVLKVRQWHCFQYCGGRLITFFNLVGTVTGMTFWTLHHSAQCCWTQNNFKYLSWFPWTQKGVNWNQRVAKVLTILNRKCLKFLSCKHKTYCSQNPC